MPAVLVTGVSTGIGHATARLLRERGLHVFGSVRRQEDAERLRAELGASFTPLVFDVTDAGAVHAAARQVGAALGDQTLLGLVNNAGIALPGPLIHQDVEEVRRQLDVNVVGTLIVTQAFAPLLGADRTRRGTPGRIVNMSSIAGGVGFPFIGGYVASKHALEGLSQSLRRELLLFGIDVVVVGPGDVVTAIWDKAEALDLRPYAQTAYAPFLEGVRRYMLEKGRRGYPAERVAEVVWTALTARKPAPRYAVVAERLKNWTLPRLLPTRAIDRLVARQLGWARSPRGG